MSDIEKRLREAHPMSAQCAYGSTILLDAADRIAALEAKCRAVEIDRDSWRRLAERYETNCTGRHGSQMSCGNVPTALETKDV